MIIFLCFLRLFEFTTLFYLIAWNSIEINFWWYWSQDLPSTIKTTQLWIRCVQKNMLSSCPTLIQTFFCQEIGIVTEFEIMVISLDTNLRSVCNKEMLSVKMLCLWIMGCLNRLLHITFTATMMGLMDIEEKINSCFAIIFVHF